MLYCNIIMVKPMVLYRALASAVATAVMAAPSMAWSCDRDGLVGHRYNPFLALSDDEPTLSYSLSGEAEADSSAKLTASQSAPEQASTPTSLRSTAAGKGDGPAS